MLKKGLVTCAVGVWLSIGLTAAVVPQTSTQESQESTESETSRSDNRLHVEGCVFVNGEMSTRRPVMGRDYDYVLSVTNVVAGQDTLADGARLRLEQVEQDRLRDLFGGKAGVTGRLEETSGLSELHVISIRKLNGTCPPAPRS